MKLNSAKSKATYEVKYTFKKVGGESRELSGKLEEKGTSVIFELTVPIRSFKSTDKDLDAHMLEVTRPESFPEARARGEISKEVFLQDRGRISAQVEFFGVTRTYEIELEKKATKAKFLLDLDAHGIERPSLLGIKIKNEVAMNFELSWE